MKTFKRSGMPDAITHNGKVHKLDIEKSHLHGEGKSFAKKDCIVVIVSDRRLRGKLDLHGQPYKPTTWIFSVKDTTEKL